MQREVQNVHLLPVAGCPGAAAAAAAPAPRGVGREVRSESCCPSEPSRATPTGSWLVDTRIVGAGCCTERGTLEDCRCSLLQGNGLYTEAVEVMDSCSSS